MEKIKIDCNVCMYPMPMVLVGSIIEEKVNFMAVGWVSRVNFKPPMLAIALGPHFTNKGIETNRAFSVNIPDVSLLEKTDYCGLVSGAKADKSQLFDVFYGEMKTAPLISQCTLNLVCTVYDTLELPFNTLYVGEIVEAYSEECYLTEGKPDIKKIRPFTLSMPDNTYWEVGKALGSAWSIGKSLKTKV
jgi:flavin reductase (DIM6/NTAB) family NADH-FMN oxidoreductase RutF